MEEAFHAFEESPAQPVCLECCNCGLLRRSHTPGVLVQALLTVSHSLTLFNTCSVVSVNRYP
jgi:hypothetical protein